MAEAGTFEASFQELFCAAYRAAFRVTGDPEASEDAAGEALARAALRWRRIADRALPWVIRVATNLSIDHLRHEGQRTRSRPVPRSDDPADPADAIDLHRALATLPTRQREVVVLRYFGDLTEAQIAEELGLAPGTVKSHASRGLASLRAVLEDRPPSTGVPDLQPEELS